MKKTLTLQQVYDLSLHYDDEFNLQQTGDIEYAVAQVFLKEIILSAFDKVNIYTVGILSKEEYELYIKLAGDNLERSDQDLKAKAIGLCKTLYFYNPIHGELFNARYINQALFEVVDKVTRNYLNISWWEVWVKSDDWVEGLENIRNLPKRKKYQQHFITLMEKKFGNGCTVVTMNDYWDSSIYLPNAQNAFLRWLRELIKSLHLAPAMKSFVTLVINDPELKTRLLEEASEALLEYKAIAKKEKSK